MTTSKPLEPALSNLLLCWQWVQHVLHAHQPAATDALDLAGLAVYHHCAYTAFAQPADARRASELVGQLIAVSEQLLSSSAWLPRQFEQACTLAWLQGRHAAGSAGPQLEALLAHFDQLLVKQVDQLPQSGNLPFLTPAMRYLSLRLPATAASQSLQQLLAHQAAPSSSTPCSLGLPNGLAGELLLRLRLHRLGLPDATLFPYLHAGITRLLATRREVDFSQNHYSVFPYQVASSPTEGLFSTALTWSRGDLSQVLVLYEASQLLHDDELIKIADLVGLNTMLRTTIPATKVVGSRFSRGAAGVAHLYYRLHQIRGQAAYNQGYIFWLDQTQQWLQQELIAPDAIPQAGELLHGLTGVGLVLLAAVTRTDSEWDCILF